MTIGSEARETRNLSIFNTIFLYDIKFNFAKIVQN